jgi:hypothetical protein
MKQCKKILNVIGIFFWRDWRSPRNLPSLNYRLQSIICKISKKLKTWGILIHELRVRIKEMEILSTHLEPAFESVTLNCFYVYFGFKKLDNKKVTAREQVCSIELSSLLKWSEVKWSERNHYFYLTTVQCILRSSGAKCFKLKRIAKWNDSSHI